MDRDPVTFPFNDFDLHFALFLEKLAKSNGRLVFAVAALVSRFCREGHICLDLKQVAGQRLVFDAGENNVIELPDVSSLKAALEDSGVAGGPNDYFPLIIDDKFRLYLFRYFDYENRLIHYLQTRMNNFSEERVKSNFPIGEEQAAKNLLDQLFPEKAGNFSPYQKYSALLAYHLPFFIITGGPGTGKTTTVVKIMAFLIGMSKGRPPRIALAAPTGKAAARLQETVSNLKEELLCPDWIKEQIPARALTLHRLLKPKEHSPYFFYHRENPLPYDVVIVDEASMVDLPLLTKLVGALLPQTKLILVGDKNQLASVEAGAVLGDLCGDADGHPSGRLLTSGYFNPQERPNIIPESSPHMADFIITLKENFRFPAESSIGKLSAAVVQGDGERAMTILRANDDKEVSWRDLPENLGQDEEFRHSIINNFKEYAHAVNNTDDISLIIRTFNRYRLLTALRQGPWGAPAVSALVEKILQEAGLLPRSPWFTGRPIMIIENNYQLDLFNGDVGILMKGGQGDKGMVFFLKEGGKTKKIPLALLPEHESAFALTIHKAQGSEFDHLLILLPDRDVPIMTRELIYTAVTRCRKTLSLWGKEELLKLAIGRKTARSSGLRDRLWTT